MRARIDITEVERRTKIRAKYLRAMENEEWDLLPGPVYVKSFLKTYADSLGLDSRLLIDEFRRRYEGPSDHDVRPMAGIGRERERDRNRRQPRGPLVPSWAVVALVLVGVVVVLYVIGSHSGSGTKTTPITTGTTTHRRHTTTVPARHHHPRRRRAPTTVALRLVPTGTVWVCLVTSTDQTLIPGTTYDVGQTIPAETGKVLYLTLGTSAVQMKLNGRTYPVTSPTDPINLKLTPKGVSSFTPGQGPACT